MDQEKDRLAILSEDAVQGFTAHCGLEAVSLEAGRFVTRVHIRDVHLQQDGFVHAGLIATMADHTAGYASFSLVPPDRRILTVEYKINFLSPASGDYLECRSAHQVGQDPARDRIRCLLCQRRPRGAGRKGPANHGSRAAGQSPHP